MTILRLATAADGPDIAALYAPIVNETAISFETEPPSAAEMTRRVEGTLRRWPWLVCAGNEGPLGYAYATAHRSRAAYQWSADVSVYAAPVARRRGVGRALYTALLDLLRLQGYVNAYAAIALPNPASVALHEALGFRQVGVYRKVGYKLGAWRDVGWWELTLQPHPEPPAQPLPFAAVRDRPEVAAVLESGESLLRQRAPGDHELGAPRDRSGNRL